MSASRDRRSALLVPVEEAEPVVGALRRVYDPVAQHGVPAHVTVLYPFVPPDEITDDTVAAVASALRDERAFPFQLATVGRFPDGVLYLAPDPSESFLALTRLLAAAFPACPPYGGRFEVVVPHLTVADCDGAPLDEIEAKLAARLPIAAHAARVDLIVEGADQRWTVRASFPLVSADRT
jgi:2'-5' RNA ligase